MGLGWHDARTDAPAPDDLGVYRIVRPTSRPLDNLGQGLVASRLGFHARSWALDPAAESSGRSVWGRAGLDLGSLLLPRAAATSSASPPLAPAGPSVVLASPAGSRTLGSLVAAPSSRRREP